MQVIIGGQTVTLDPSKSKGKGGEADIFDLGGGLVAKIYKGPKHADIQNMKNPAERAAAEQAALHRIAEHQKKLPAFPKGLPQSVIGPLDLVRAGSKKQIVGFTMTYIDQAEVLLFYGAKQFRLDNQIGNDKIVPLFRELHRTVQGTHKAGVVIGDFNDLNVLVRNYEPLLIDADSMQFGGFQCHVFTESFVDPLICKPDEIIQVRPHSEQTDWYAFNIMLMRSLLFVGPYGGVLKGKGAVPDGKRPLHRITVFDPKVTYPKPAIHYGVLPDDLLEHFHRVFEQDLRQPFPEKLLDMQWQDCPSCGVSHARRVCPTCGAKGLGQVVQRTVVRGTVMATRIFETSGHILAAAHQNGQLRWLYHENGQFHREDKKAILAGTPSRFMRYRLSGKRTLISRGDQLVTLDDTGKALDTKRVDTFAHVGMFDANGHNRYWLQAGRLMRDGRLGMDYPEAIGDVLQGQTVFWVGEDSGFGYYRAGDLNRAFIFRPDAAGLIDVNGLPPFGQLVDSVALPGKSNVFAFYRAVEGAKRINRCMVIDLRGNIVAQAEAEDGQPGWLGTLRGKVVVGNNLLCATDEGIVKVEVNSGGLDVTKEFPDSEPFVDAASHLFVGADGLFVVKANVISELKIR